MQATRRAVVTETALALPVKEVMLRHAATGLLLLAAAAFLAGAVRAGQQWLAQARITSVQIDGDLQHVNMRGIAVSMLPLVKGSYFSVNLVAIHDVVAASPWVDQVRVSRRWPNGVRVYIREKQPVARWGQQGFISSHGELFAPALTEGLETLPVLLGPAGQSRHVMEQYRAMNSILRGLGMSLVELELSERMSWFLRLDNGIRLMIDQVDPIKKLQRFAYLYDRQLKPVAANMVLIDLRYRNGVSVGWKTPISQKVAAPGM